MKTHTNTESSKCPLHERPKEEKKRYLKCHITQDKDGVPVNI